jgi:hypothetical protein
LISFSAVKNIVDAIRTDARAIEAAQEQFSCSEMEGQLALLLT